MDMQRRRELKRKLLARETVLATWISLGHPSIAEIFARTGAQAVCIDIEHSTISQAESQRIIAAAQAGGACCLPRIATHDNQMIKRLLDSGADGIIAPTVETPGQASDLVSWMKYPPQGRRGFGVARAQGYGFDFARYTTDWNGSSTLIVQIESVLGVENIDAILAVDGVDGAMVGPYDLSGSLGIPGQIDHPRVAESARLVAEACKRAGKACGTQLVEPTAESLAAARAAGYTFIVLASDIFVLWKWSERVAGLIAGS